VGLASYLLIGFWFKKPSASAAAIKAFVVNRVGDLGFMLGIFGTFLVFQTTSIPEILAAAPAMSGSTITFVGMRLYTMDILCILLFIGAMGKSAQLGLHTWLPDAMEGPTPVSALIHAATMVTAGVFMLCRLSPMFETAPTALVIVTFIGAATCFFAATIGTTQWDIKRVIAYSTCSQLGYMFFAAGVGAYGVAMFHLFTHAFFKALLFLGAGSVIHAMHHEQDMRYYGGLRKVIPFTFWAMMAGTLAITGVGVLYVFGFAGFYSKDAILEAAWARGTGMGQFAFWAGAIAALLTSFYSWRLMFLTFWGKPRWIESEHIQHAVHKTPEDAGEDSTGGYHPHESPLTMLIPLGVLTVGAVFAGFFFKYPFIDSYLLGTETQGFWGNSIYFNEELIHALHGVPYWVKLTATASMLIGFAGAVYAYILKPGVPAAFVRQFGALHNFVFNKWYFDELYNLIFVKPAFWLGRQFWKLGDIGTIDRFGPNGVAWAVDRGAAAAKTIQSGYLNTYALIMLLGLIAAITYVLL
jgi:NADH-quinone oxidoreductase subunit L